MNSAPRAMSRSISLLPATFVTAAAVFAAAPVFAQPAPNRALPPASAEHVARVDAALPEKARVAPKQPRLILVTARTEGYFHDSIPIGLHAFRQMGERTGAFRVEADHEMSAFTAENLARFDAVLFLSTTQLAFADESARAALLGFVRGGKGLIGIHAASDNFPKWPEGQGLIGGVFHSHPWLWNQTAAVKLDEPAHPLNEAFGGQGFWIREEIYQIVGPYGRDRQRVLMSIDTTRPENERPADQIVRTDGDFPIGWLKTEGKGRVFYSSLGHNEDVYWTPEVLQHWLDGIQFALGDLAAPSLPSSTLSPAPVPALAPALQETLLERAAARADAAQAFTLENLDAVAHHTDDRDPAALHRVSAALRESSPEARAEARAALVALAARKDLTPAATQAVIDWLGDIGDAKAVSVLTTWARQPVTADRAIRALARIGVKQADAALLDLLKSAPSAHRPAVVSAIAHRRIEKAAKPLAAQLRAADHAQVAQALDALSRIGSKDAVGALTRFKAPATLIADHHWALIHAASVLHQDGDTRAAITLMRDLAARDGLTPAQRVAVAISRVQLEPVAALPATQPLLADAFVGPRLAQAWLRAALQAPDSARHLDALREHFKTLPESMQVTVLALAAQFGEAQLAPVVREAVTSPSAPVRRTAYSALAGCGDLTDAAVLIRALDTPEERPGAVAALEHYQASGLDSLLRTDVATAAPDVRAALLLVLGHRLDREAMPLMVAAASAESRGLRTAGFSGLAALARGEDLPLVLSLRPQLQPADRRHWQEALRAAVRGRNDVPETVALLRKEIETSSPAERPSFIHAIVGFETPESTEAVRQLLTTDDLERRKEVIRVLAAARNDVSYELLITIAEEDADSATRTLALRGFLDTLALRQDRWSETIRAYGRAGRAALRQEERDAVIAALTQHYTGDEAEAIIEELRKLSGTQES